MHARTRRRHGVTLLELLVVIAVIALLAGVLMPALGAARERGRVAVCLSNLHSIGAGVGMYQSENHNLPWTYVHGVDDQGDFQTFPGASGFTSFSWGGMLPPVSPGAVDSQVTPVELRPMTPYLSPGASGFDTVRVYVCPSDRSASNPGIGGGPGTAAASFDPSGAAPNWRVFGTSYSINWHWIWSFAGCQPEMTSLVKRLLHFGPELIRNADAGRLIIVSENHFDQMMGAALAPGQRPQGGQGFGWHRRFSHHAISFLDGHAEYRRLDTQFTSGPGWLVR